MADRPVRTPLVSGNWKMHLNHFEAIQVVQKLSYALGPDDYAATDVSVHPPFTDLRSVQTVLEADDIPIAVGAQHCHDQEKGAFTGEVSPSMLAKLNVRYVIAGHSERRHVFGQTDDEANARVRAVLAHGMTPILCVGETLDEREAGRTEERVSSQVRAGLAGVGADDVGGMVIAYEPVWAIGTGRNATPEDAQEVCAAIRRVVSEGSGASAGEGIRIQYGGSVKSSNAAELLAAPDVDGALVGGASLDPAEFASIVQSVPRGR
jgi:triosephosphate isomerase (TIM)